MKHVISIFAFATTLLASSAAFAQRDSSLKHDELVDCIVVEGSGENYSEWKERFETDYRESQQKLQQADAEKRTASDKENASIAGLE